MRISKGYSCRAETGFTYLGVLILVAVLGITTTTALTLGALIERRMAEEELLYVGEQYRAALESYSRATPAGSSRYPMTLQDLLRDPRYPDVRRHLRKIYLDPLTSKDDWILVQAPGGGIIGLHSASQRVPIKIANFPPPLQTFEGKESYSDWVFSYLGSMAPPSLVTPNRPGS
ncbi:type II secretion system GspH family protein [Ralstonia sp. CHL-2022]|uniref:Type II secretion system GspH family protein n=1 Tax=Ralstonia mojiangensis TaxID=2953895 RepID=A0ABT2LEN6_9RALS|nr:type II secretion system GspH family protein [Ralstonia mojiangensis]